MSEELPERDFARAPWTPEQVESLNGFQASNAWHPFTCGGDSCRAVLVATPEGWTCPECGGWKQDWAHAFMVDGSWRAHAEWLAGWSGVS